MMAKRLLIVVIVVALGVAAFWVGRMVRGGAASSPDASAAVASREEGKNGRSVLPKRKPKTVRVAMKIPKPVLALADDDDDDEPKKTPAEKALAAKIEKALNDEDIQLARDCASEAMKCKNVEIRQSMVDTLGWFGEKALAELTMFLADSDEDVADDAMNEWEMAVSEIEDDTEKIGIVEMAMQIIANEDALESISSEYIGVDEKLAVESLLRIIEGGASEQGIAKAKETYEFVTGDAFVSRAAAEKWMAEEYQPSGIDDGE